MNNTRAGLRYFSRCFSMLLVKSKHASSTFLFALYANRRGSSCHLTPFKSSFKTNLSNTFIMAGVRATGLRSFIDSILLRLGTGKISAVFHNFGITFDVIDKLKM